MQPNYFNLANKRLLLVVGNFGLNFSGGSTATAIAFEYFELVFEDVVILCAEEGNHNLQKARIHNYRNGKELSLLIDAHTDNNTVGFGDFYLAEVLLDKNIPYFFVYHDNYPEMKNFSSLSEEEDDKMISTYSSIFKYAKHVFSVSEYASDFIKHSTAQVSIVRNGLSQKITKFKQRARPQNTLKVLMAGNIDHRKYRNAIEVFDQLEKLELEGIEIDIYGNSNNETLQRRLSTFNFVTYKGFQKSISYDNYDLYLNTSLVENLSLSVVDALANKTPVVSFDVGGINEVISNFQNGVVIPAFECQEMAKALISIKENGLPFKMGDKILEQFDWETSSAKMLSIMNVSLEN